MQHLQWFPGHMTAAIRMMEENIKAVDGVVIVLDARVPFASQNKKFEKLFNGKKILYLLNKTDLADDGKVRLAQKKMEEEGKTVVSLSALDKRAVDSVYNKLLSLFKEKIERYKEKGVFLTVRFMVVGIPNTGKSTVINALSGGKKTATGNKAGVTRGKQWVRLKDIELLDTPGTMPPAFDNQTFAKHLAYIGSMNDANIDFNDLAYEFLGEIRKLYPDKLKEKYDIEGDISSMEILDIFNAICVRRGFLMRGGDYDYERCSTAIIDDFRKGRLGKISLE